MPGFDRLTLGDTRTVWIFGAGASAGPPYSVPAQNKLLAKFAQMRPRGPVGDEPAGIEVLQERVRALCLAVQPGLRMEDEKLSLEEVFSAYELACAEKRTTAPQKETARAALRDLREAVRRATYTFGRGDAQKWKPHARNATPSAYAELLESIFPKDAWEPVIGRHVFITINYDINLDRCIVNMFGGAQVDIDLDYGIALANGRCDDAPAFHAPRDGRSVLLLRAHGALNWLRCLACQSVFTTVDRHANVAEDARCWACRSENVDYVLVPPSSLREYNDPLLQVVWGRALEELVRAERWVFVGYSLPTADVHFRELLRYCRRVRGEAGTKICVVGRNVGTELADMTESYRRAFGDEIDVWRATAAGFAEFPACIDA